MHVTVSTAGQHGSVMLGFWQWATHSRQQETVAVCKQALVAVAGSQTLPHTHPKHTARTHFSTLSWSVSLTAT